MTKAIVCFKNGEKLEIDNFIKEFNLGRDLVTMESDKFTYAIRRDEILYTIVGDEDDKQVDKS